MYDSACEKHSCPDEGIIKLTDCWEGGNDDRKLISLAPNGERKKDEKDQA